MIVCVSRTTGYSCVHAYHTDNCHRYRHHRNNTFLKVCALWRRVCLNAPASAHACVSVRSPRRARLRSSVCDGWLTQVGVRSGALHCDVRVAALTYGVCPSLVYLLACTLACADPRRRGRGRPRVGMSEGASAVRAHERGSSAPAILLSHRLQAMVHRKLCALSLSPPLTCDAGSARTLTRYSLWPTTPSSSSRCCSSTSTMCSTRTYRRFMDSARNSCTLSTTSTRRTILPE